jgi:hypothetical protein
VDESLRGRSISYCREHSIANDFNTASTHDQQQRGESSSSREREQRERTPQKTQEKKKAVSGTIS